MVMIITVCMAAGFQEAVQNKIFGFWGHIRIQEKQPSLSVMEKMNPIEKNDSFVQQLKKHPAIVSVHPFATQYALLKTRNEMEGILLKGVDDKVAWSKYATFLKKGSVPKIELSDFSRGILVSQQQAKRLQLHVNDSIVLYFTQQEGPPRAKKVFIAGIFQTGIEEYDRLFALADLRLIRQVSGWTENQVGGYEIFVRDPSNLDKIANELYQAENFPATWDAIPINKVAPQLFDWLNMQVVTRNVLIAIMTIVALINLITSLLVLVLERIQMIGILKALGAADKTIQQLFLRYALLLTTAGILVGTLLAFVLMGLQQKTGFIHLDESAYYIDKIEFKIMPVPIALIMVGTLIISLLVLLLPTLLVKRISPIRAIRFS
ncbi:MAG: ABC transporter permease [Chitinophagaceae bacterium]|nr:ABC transporter permease [Chitinophagaceae bacterium]